MQFPRAGRLLRPLSTAAVKLSVLFATIFLMVLFVQNLLDVVYAKFNIKHEIMLVHNPSWGENPARMVDFHQMTSSTFNESQQLLNDVRSSSPPKILCWISTFPLNRKVGISLLLYHYMIVETMGTSM